MSYTENSKYRPPFFLFNRHIETMYPALFRKVILDPPRRERLELNDGDFLDLDWYKNNKHRLVIINHGLEGNSNKAYILGMAKTFIEAGWDVLAWNFRGCSGEINRLPRFYHSGETGDMREIVNHASKDYGEIFLVGFSLGGNMLLKYLGENEINKNESLIGAAVFSVPVHLHSSCLEIMKPGNVLYQKRFLNNLKKKVIEKSKVHPGVFKLKEIMEAKTIMDFDDNLTAPIHGFKDAADYYEKNSALNFLQHIKIPTLLVNAKNDPMLSDLCFPQEQAKNHEFLHFEKWNFGGHVGFYDRGNLYKSEKSALLFAQYVLNQNES